MEKENKLILLSSLQEKSNDEVEIIEKIMAEPIDWAYVIGQLIHHRLTGYFINGLPKNCQRYMFKEVKKQLELIVKLNQVITDENMKYMQQIFNEFEEEGIGYAGLKGVVYNASLYDIGMRRSNDIDVLVLESELKKADSILRKHGFIQSLNSGKPEASKRDKIIQRLNHHDLVPYYKKNDDSVLLPYFKIDINFRIDSEKEGLTEKIFDFGTVFYTKNGYKIRGLKWETHLLHLCIHFSREASHSLWVSDKRDCMLYKIIDIENTIRAIGADKLEEWINSVKQFECDDYIYFTFYYLNQFYPNEEYQKVMDMTKTDNQDCVKDIKILGTKDVVKRERSFIDSTFDLTYCIDFSKADYQNVIVQ